MSNPRVTLKLSGIRKVLRSPEVTALVARKAKRAAAAAGPGFESVVKPHKYTARAFVQTATPEAAKAEAENKTLTRSLDAMRS